MMASIADEVKCQYTFLGNSGLRVSNICLGTATFGEIAQTVPGQLEEKGAHQIIDRFVQWGGNFIDTANMYGRGNAEKIVGSWLAGQERDKMVIATKSRMPMDDNNVNAVGLSRRHIVKSLEDSLQRLQTHYIDLLQMHVWDDAVPLEETLMTLNDLVRCGKVRYLGASNVTGWQMQKIVELVKQMGLNRCISLQQQYSLITRDSELEPFQVCKLNGVGVLCWSPLKGGFLTDDMKRGQKPKEGRLGWSAEDETRHSESWPAWTVLNQEKNWTILDTAQKIAKAKGKSVAQVSLRWLLQKPVVSSVIMGINNTHQVDENMAASKGWQLTPEEMKELDDASKPELPYPYRLIWRANKARNNPWNPSAYV